MPHNWWKNLSDDAKNKIILDAKEKYDKAGRTICYWCGSILKLDEAYDLTSNSKPNDLYKICNMENHYVLIVQLRRYLRNTDFQ